MLATAGPVPTGDGWSFEFKWDGVRSGVAVDPAGMVRAISRNIREITRSYPELRQLPALTHRHRVVLDGELVVLDERGRPSFQLLAHRMHVQAPTRPLLTRTPVQFYVFDLLWIDDQSLLHTPFLERRERLTDLDLNHEGLIRTPPHYTDTRGPDLLAVARDHALEGVVAKRLTSLYYPGKRSSAWIKTPLRTTQEVIIGGWTAGNGGRSGTVGALLLGVHDASDGRLRYVGRVGTGFTRRMLHDMQAMLETRPRSSSPFEDEVPREDARAAHWVTPDLVGEVEHREWTAGDNRLRHPSWRGLRSDREPGEVKAEFFE